MVSVGKRFKEQAKYVNSYTVVEASLVSKETVGLRSLTSGTLSYVSISLMFIKVN